MMSILNYTRIIALLLCITWYTKSAFGQTFISEPPSEKFERQFTTVELPWTFSRFAGELFSVQWKYKSRTDSDFHKIYSVNSTGGMSSKPADLLPQFLGRVEFKGDVANRDATIAVKMFTELDEGEYQCTVIGPNRVSSITTLRAIVISNVTKFAANKENDNTDDIKEGDNITLSCTVTKGQPSPKIEILKDDRVINDSLASEIKETTLNYEIRSISKESRGSYSCRVTTQEYSGQSKVYELTVQYPPVWVNPAKELRGCKDKMMSLPCKADGNPKATVSRFDPDGKKIPNEQFVLKTFGVYRCEAVNNLGTIFHNTTISEEKDGPGKPTFASDCRFKSLSWEKASTDVMFTLQFRVDDGPWKDVITTPDTNYDPSTNESFSDEIDYEFKIIAKNCVGRKESDTCLVKGTSKPSPGKSSGNNAGVIAGSVIAVLVVILIIVIAVVIIQKKRKQGNTQERYADDKVTYAPNAKPKPARTRNPEYLLPGNDSPDVNNSRPQPTPGSQPPTYTEIPDDPDAPTYTNVPSWV